MFNFILDTSLTLKFFLNHFQFIAKICHHYMLLGGSEVSQE